MPACRYFTKTRPAFKVGLCLCPSGTWQHSGTHSGTSALTFPPQACSGSPQKAAQSELQAPRLSGLPLRAGKWRTTRSQTRPECDRHVPVPRTNPHTSRRSQPNVPKAPDLKGAPRPHTIQVLCCFLKSFFPLNLLDGSERNKLLGFIMKEKKGREFLHIAMKYPISTVRDLTLFREIYLNETSNEA